MWRNFVVDPPEDTLIRKINYDENPFLSDTMLKVIDAARRRDPEGFVHVYEGVPESDDDAAIIKLSWIEAAVDAHKVLDFGPEGRKRIGFDVADSGADKCANVYRYGSVIYWADEWKAKEDELLKSCQRTYRAAMERDADIVYDSIGVGASAGAKFSEINDDRKRENAYARRVNYQRFNAGAGVHEPDDEYNGIPNKDFFANLKAQAWWLVADRFRNTFNAINNGEQYLVDELISIDSRCPLLEKLKLELTTPHRDFDRNGRVMVESKKTSQNAIYRHQTSPTLSLWLSRQPTHRWTSGNSWGDRPDGTKQTSLATNGAGHGRRLRELCHPRGDADA
ncbi:terminase [Salmonella sp. WGH-01]|nr:terminase [Salmonella sp. WGH-01]